MAVELKVRVVEVVRDMTMRVLAVLLAGLCVSEGRAAAEMPATVHVRIVLPDPLPAGATLELQALDGRLLLTIDVPDQARDAIFRQVPQGAYRLVARLAGHREAVADLVARGATTFVYAAELRRTDAPASDSTLRLVRTEAGATDRAFDRAQLATFPGDDAHAAVVETAVAPIIVDRMATGGLWLGEAAVMGGYGSSWRQTTIVLGDLDVTDPVRIGTPLARPAQEAIDTLLVSTTMLPASVGGPGPVLTLAPKSPSRTWQGSAEFGLIAPTLQAANDLPGAPSIAKFASHRDLGAHAGGPLGRQGGLFVAARRIASARVERNDPTELGTRVTSLETTVDLTAGPQGRLRAIGSVDRAAMPYVGRARFRTPDVRETDTFATAQASWDRWTRGGTAWSVSGGFVQGVFSPSFDPVGPSDRVATAGTVERLRDGPVPTLFEGPSTRRRWSAGARVTPALPRLGSSHLLEAGVSVARQSATTEGVNAPFAAELVGGIPARVWEVGAAGSGTQWTSTDAALYLSDRLTWGRVGANVGVRRESARGAARGAADRFGWLTAAPRASARWRVDSRGHLSIFGGYARYAHRLPLDYLAWGDPSATSGLVYRWNDANGDRLLQDGERGVLVAATGPCCTPAGPGQIDPDLHRPYTDEGVFGLETRFGGWSLTITGVKRQEQDLVASVNAGVTEADYTLRYVLDPGEPFRDPPEERLLPVHDRRPSSFGRDRYLLTNAHSSSYDGFDVTIEGSVGERLRTRFDGSLYHAFTMSGNRGYQALESDPGVIGELYENPNAATYAHGHGFVDRAYVIKWWGSYAAPRDILVSAVARYQDGQPFSRLTIVPDLNQGAEAINGYRLGRTRFTFTFSLDAHVEKTFTAGRARVAGVIEVFNLLNTANEVEEDVRTGPTFRRATAVQPPRAARIGLRVGF